VDPIQGAMVFEMAVGEVMERPNDRYAEEGTTKEGPTEEARSASGKASEVCEVFGGVVGASHDAPRRSTSSNSLNARNTRKSRPLSSSVSLLSQYLISSKAMASSSFSKD
jgi:hypothetical protein